MARTVADGDDQGRDECQGEQEGQGGDRPGPAAVGAGHLPDLAGEDRRDLGEQQEGQSLAETAVGDGRAQPQHGGGPGRQAGHQGDLREHAGVAQDVRVRPGERGTAVDGRAYDQDGEPRAEQHGHIPGVTRQQRLPRPARLRRRAQAWEQHPAEHQHPVRGDHRQDAEREDREVREAAAGEQVEEAGELPVGSIGRRDGGDVDAGQGQVLAEAEQQDGQQRDEQPPAYVGHREDAREQHRVPLFLVCGTGRAGLFFLARGRAGLFFLVRRAGRASSVGPGGRVGPERGSGPGGRVGPGRGAVGRGAPR